MSDLQSRGAPDCPLATADEPGGERFSRRDLVWKGGGLVAAGTLAPALLAACGSGSSPGNGEVGGTLPTLMWQDYAREPVTGAFQSKHGVTLNNSPLASNDEILTRLRAQGPGSYSVASPNVAYVQSQFAAGELSAIDLTRVPNVAGLFQRFQNVIKKQLTFEGQVYGVPVGFGLDTMLYNKSRIKTPPTSWKDVLKPEYEGKVLLWEGPQPNFEIWPRVIGGWDPARLTPEQLEKTTDFLIELKQTQVRTIASSADDVAKLFASGEVWITASGSDPASALVANKQGGDEVAFTIPKEGAATWVDSLAMPAEPPNEATAYAFIDYMLSSKPQATHADEFEAGAVAKAAVPLVSKENRELIPYNNINQLANRAPVFVFPPVESGFTTVEEWGEAWEQIAAA